MGEYERLPVVITEESLARNGFGSNRPAQVGVQSHHDSVAALALGRSCYRDGNEKVMPRSSLALVVAGTSSSETGILRARCSLKIQSVPPTTA